MYWAATYTLYDEEKAVKPSGGVIEACKIARRVIWDELHNRDDFRRRVAGGMFEKPD